jgi:hypothetical protein
MIVVIPRMASRIKVLARSRPAGASAKKMVDFRHLTRLSAFRYIWLVFEGRPTGAAFLFFARRADVGN